MEWISTDSEMPKVGDEVLIHLEDGEINLGIFYYGKSQYDPRGWHTYVWSISGCEHCEPELKVTHWMPLPPAPEIEQ
jgi:hypothetical protein